MILTQRKDFLRGPQKSNSKKYVAAASREKIPDITLIPCDFWNTDIAEDGEDKNNRVGSFISIENA